MSVSERAAKQEPQTHAQPVWLRWLGREQLLLACGILLTVLLAALPYIALHPYFSFGIDQQHPIAIAGILTHGRPPFSSRTYPMSYEYLAASLAALAGWTPIEVSKALPAAAIAASAFALYWVARTFFGGLTATFTLLVYGALSFEPRNDWFGGAHIELVASLILAPLFLMALVKAVEEESRRWPIVAGILGGFLIQYHFLDTTIALAVSVLFLVGVLVLQRQLIRRSTLLRLAVVLSVALVLGMPYSAFYVLSYASILVSRLPVLHHAANATALAQTGGFRYQGVSFPRISLATASSRAGGYYLYMAAAALAVFVPTCFLRRRPKPAEILLLAWVMVLFLGTFENLFLDPVRALSQLSLPASIIIGLVVQRTIIWLSLSDRRAPGLRMLGRLSLCTGAMLVIFLGVAYISNRSLIVGRLTTFAAAADLPSFQALESIWGSDGKPQVLVDDSGIWGAYFTVEHTARLDGGPATFSQLAEPWRSEARALWLAAQDPCTTESVRTFQSYDIGLIYLGRKPSHSTQVGYVYDDGSAFLGCPGYTVVYDQPTPDGPIRIIRVDGGSS